MLRLGFIGTGNMAAALIRSIKSANGCSIISSDTNKDKLFKAGKEFEIATTESNKELVEKSDLVFLCVKPKDIDSVLAEIRDSIQDKIIISIAAGIKISHIEKIMGKGRKVVRVMPNVNCIVGEMAAAYTTNENMSARDKVIVQELLDCAGIALEIEEEKIDAVGALSGSGPAFVAYLIRAFGDAAVKHGLGREDAYKLTVQTFYGTSSLLKKTGKSVDELIAMVSSPGGITVAGREILENSDVSEIIDKTIEAAIKRTLELGKNE